MVGGSFQGKSRVRLKVEAKPHMHLRRSPRRRHHGRGPMGTAARQGEGEQGATGGVRVKRSSPPRASPRRSSRPMPVGDSFTHLRQSAGVRLLEGEALAHVAVNWGEREEVMCPPGAAPPVASDCQRQCQRHPEARSAHAAPHASPYIPVARWCRESICCAWCFSSTSRSASVRRCERLAGISIALQGFRGRGEVDRGGRGSSRTAMPGLAQKVAGRAGNHAGGRRARLCAISARGSLVTLCARGGRDPLPPCHSPARRGTR